MIYDRRLSVLMLVNVSQLVTNTQLCTTAIVYTERSRCTLHTVSVDLLVHTAFNTQS